MWSSLLRQTTLRLCDNAASKMSETTTEAKPRKLVAISQPISVLPSNIARIYTNIHPILILALYYFCFPSLVADPVSTLKKTCAPLAHLQITYCVVCLPPSSGSSTPASKSSKTPQKKRVQFAKPPSTKPIPLAARIIVSCAYFHSMSSTRLLELINTVYFLARHILPPSLPHSRRAAPYDNTDSLRCAPYHTLLA